MKRRLFIITIFLFLLLGCLFGARPLRAKWLLYSATKRTNTIYAAYRPFAYRWIGAPYKQIAGTDDCVRAPQNQINRLLLDIGRLEQFSGQTSDTLQLRGRAGLLSCVPEESIQKYKLALLLTPGNPSLNLELGIAYALRANTEERALDYERAIEQILVSVRRRREPGALFDASLLLENAFLPNQSLDYWREAQNVERSAQWRQEEQRRCELLQSSLHARQVRIEHLTTSPASYLSHSNEAQGSIELVVEKALQDWLPIASNSAINRQALTHLSHVLQTQYRDRWLADMLEAPDSPANQQGVLFLSEAWKANLHGEHNRAASLAESARSAFTEAHNQAGILRSQFEEVYALDRVWHEKQCLVAMQGLRSKAHNHQYSWIEGQALLERASCLVQTRNVGVINFRQTTRQWVAKSGYTGLQLRAQTFLTEQYGGFDSRLRIWTEGFKSLQMFWQNALPPLRGYFSYYSLAVSAHAAGNSEAALALLNEGIRLLEQAQNPQLLGLVLADQANWELQDGLKRKSQITFDRMEQIFEHLDKNDRDFWRESEITHADADLSTGEAHSALARLRKLTMNLQFPYPSFGPSERRRLLPAYGNVYLALGDLCNASRYFSEIIKENLSDLHRVHDPVQRDSGQKEIEPAWKGLTEVYLRGGCVSDSSNPRQKDNTRQALETWEAFRSGWLGKPHPKKIEARPGVTFLIYAFLPNGLSAWSVSSSGIQQTWIDAHEAILAARRFSETAATPDSPPPIVTTEAKKLYSLLLGPFSSTLPTTGLLVIDADGELAGVPWAALQDPAGTALLERFSLAQVDSLDEISDHNSSRLVDLSDALIVANPALGSELASWYPPLSAIEFEADALHQMLPHATYIADAQATAANVTSSLSSASLLHFAGHGISYGGFGALLVAPSPTDRSRISLLNAEEIGQLNLSRLSLAVLASCSSGQGESTGSVNLDSLVRGFMKAGTHRVVAARWKVSSEATADLMISFYKSLLNGSRPSEALRQAALLVRRNPATAHPYYWAAFQAFGDP